MKLSGKDAMKSLSKGFDNNKESSIRKIKTVLDDVSKSINKHTDKFTTSGENVVKGFIKGIKK